MSSAEPPAPLSAWRERMRIIIFEADTRAGKAFDVGLLVAIGLSILAVMLETVPGIESVYGPKLRAAEWVFTGLFLTEYILRLLSVPHPRLYARSFFGIVDLLSILPSFISLLLPGSQSMLVIRALRLLRVFRVFKLARFMGEANFLATAMRASSRKIAVFLGTLCILVTILGTIMFLVEGEDAGFSSIPQSMYWAIVTMTTVGYGDIVPHTVGGKIVASFVMMIGYAIIAIPTGIVTAEIVSASRQRVSTRSCSSCMDEGHSASAHYCKNCGEPLSDPPTS
ncbi:MAG: ion transporter [Myxococcota bacterium]|nr:ion transporter [Myxococcota bacterium]